MSAKSFLLIDSGGSAAEHQKFSHSALNRAEETGMAFTPRLAMLWENLLRFPADTEEVLDQLDRTTRASDWQETRLELPQLHVLPTGLAVARGRVKSLELLVARGGLVSWPDEEDLSQTRLTGSEDRAYNGVRPEPLAEAVAWAFWSGSSPKEFSGVLAVLEGAGASPVKDDPATGRSALEEMLVGFENVFGWDHFSAHQQGVWVDTLTRWFPQDPQSLESLLSGEGDGLLGPLEELGIGDRVRARLLEKRLVDQWAEPSSKRARPRV